MEPDPAIPSIVETSSKKKKSKKEKKKRKRDESMSPSIINGSNVNGSSSSKKKKKEKKKKKDKVDDKTSSKSEGAPSDQEQQPADSREQTSSQQKQPIATKSTAGPTISSLTAKPTRPEDGAKLKKSPYQKKTILGTVALLPSSLPDVTKCIQTLLHSLLLMYDANMGGVLLSLEEDGIKLLPIDHSRNNNPRSGGGGGLVGGRIVDDLPYLHYRFQVKGLLFCPVVGMKLRGQVVECTSTYITLTTHHILSTKISTAKLHEQGFFYNSTTLEWTRERDTSSSANFSASAQRRDSGGGAENGEEEDDMMLGPSTSIYLDDIVEFVVERIHECGGYISLDGTRPSVTTLS